VARSACVDLWRPWATDGHRRGIHELPDPRVRPDLDAGFEDRLVVGFGDATVSTAAKVPELVPATVAQRAMGLRRSIRTRISRGRWHGWPRS
jgi:hypothetical protein